MPPPISRAFENAMWSHRRALDRILDRRSATDLKRFYDRAQDELTRKLAASVRLGKGESMSALQMQQLLAQVREAQARIAESVANGFTPIIRDTQADGVRQAASTIRALEEKFTGATVRLPLEEAATFQGILGKRSTSLIKANERSFARYGARVTQQVENELALSLATGETPLEAIDRVRAVADNQWWQAERIVRTEGAYAFNAAHADSISEAQGTLPDLMNRWSEHVDDATGAPLDARVAEDSLVLHGQVVPVGANFVMPPDPRVEAKRWNQTYAQPPNRPNDRAVLLPWRPRWGGYAWTFKGGRRVNVGTVKR